MKQKTVQRNTDSVVQLHCEINRSLYGRLVDVSIQLELSKRDIVSLALLEWLNAKQGKVEEK